MPILASLFELKDMIVIHDAVVDLEAQIELGNKDITDEPYTLEDVSETHKKIHSMMDGVFKDLNTPSRFPLEKFDMDKGDKGH